MFRGTSSVLLQMFKLGEKKRENNHSKTIHKDLQNITNGNNYHARTTHHQQGICQVLRRTERRTSRLTLEEYYDQSSIQVTFPMSVQQ